MTHTHLIRERNGRQEIGCDACVLPVARVNRNCKGLVLVVESKHGGRVHTKVFTAADLRRLADELEGDEK
jgi:hypothetical protein